MAIELVKVVVHHRPEEVRVPERRRDVGVDVNARWVELISVEDRQLLRIRIGTVHWPLCDIAPNDKVIHRTTGPGYATNLTRPERIGTGLVLPSLQV